MVVAVAMFSTLLLHIRRSSSQSASPELLHAAIVKPGGGEDDWTPSNSLSERGTVNRRGYCITNTCHTTAICLPKLGEKDSHDRGHVDVDVHRERHLWSI